ncbi:protein EMBRYONIC FLOWER 1 isoform X2 [Hevea brasiliensis]|uniref:protein EMBRYONIC FLOWER 1 isoform X2 n=1 Tax=Hevea brasiliensis TaxID=3981 RepID=UPI0025E21D5A|nr:protein EMBRYONIC FLOWER 1 isoform X2 [Hevea brasiliensis]
MPYLLVPFVRLAVKNRTKWVCSCLAEIRLMHTIVICKLELLVVILRKWVIHFEHWTLVYCNMEKNIVVEDQNRQSSDSIILSKSMESSIKIDSISIDLINANEKTDAENCEHFSIRGYVSEICKKDWKMCWPFASEGDSNKHDEQACGLPSLHVPKFRYWRCHNCLSDIGAKCIGNDYGPIIKSCGGGLKSNSICFHASILGDVAMLLSGFQQALKRHILEKKVDANASTVLNNTTEYHPVSGIDKKENKTEVAIPAIVNLKSRCNGSIDLCKPACGRHEVADAELAGNLNCTVTSSFKIHEMGKVISAADQHNKLTASGISGEAGNIEKACNADKRQASGYPSLELDECNYASSESAETVVGNNFQDLHDHNSSGLHRRKTRKVRLLTDLLRENGDGDTDNARTDDSLSNVIPDASAVGDKLNVPLDQVAISGNVRRGLGQPRKRKLDQDEDWRPLETGSPSKVCKEVRTLKRDVEFTDAIAKAFSRMHLQTSMKNNFTKRGIDGSPSIGKKKNKKSLIFNERSSLAFLQEKVPNEIANKTGDVSNSVVSDGVLLKLMHNEVTGREAEFLPLSPQRMDRKSSFKKKNKMPQVDNLQASLIPWNHDMLKEYPINRKDVEFLQTEPVRLPFYSVPDASSEKGLNLSLNSYLTTQKYDMQHNLQVEGRRMSLITQQEGTAEDQVNKNAAETKHVGNFSFVSKLIPDVPFGKRVFDDLSSKRTTNRIPTSQFDINKKNFVNTSGNMKTIGIQECSAATRKDSDSEQGTLDDVPMEIVELMAKHQYERGLPDAKYDRCQLEMANNAKTGQAMDFNKAYGNREMSLFQQETSQKRNPLVKNGRNGITKRSENVEPTEQKSIEYFSQADLNQFNVKKLQQNLAPAGFDAFFQHQEKQSSRVHHSPSSSGRQNSTQNCKWAGDVVGKRSFRNCLQTSGTCNACQGIPQQSKETNHLWSTMMPNHMPFVYSIPQKCAPLSTNIDVLSSSTSSIPKENTNGNRDLKFLNQNASRYGRQNCNFSSETRTCADYPFACKHNGIEPNQKPMGSLDLYSNETIPAMHLLSLMDAGLPSHAPINLTVTPKFLNRPSITHDQKPNEFSKLDSGAYKATNTMKHTSYDCRGKNKLAEDYNGCISAIPAVVGSSASSFKHDKCFKKSTGFSCQVSPDKVKGRGSDSCTQNKGCRSQKPIVPGGNFGTNCGSIPVHSMQTMFFGASDSMVSPLQVCRLENLTKHKVKSPSGTQPVHPNKSSSETGACSVNRNPADFTVPESGNLYMIAGEDLKFGKLVPLSNGNGSTKLVGRKKRPKKLPAVKEHR